MLIVWWTQGSEVGDRESELEDRSRCTSWNPFPNQIKRLLQAMAPFILLHLLPPLSITPQLTAQKHKNSKYRVWHMEASSTWWFLPLPVVPLDLGTDRLCEQNFREACKGHLRSWILITFQKLSGIFVYPKNHSLIFWGSIVDFF